MITVNAAPCWHRLPTNAQEEADLADWDPHYATMAELADDADPDETGRPVLGKAFPGPCRTLACDDCGDLAENQDVGGIVHFEPAFPEVDIVKHSEFEEFGGKVLCDPCMENAQRDQLRKVGG